MASPADIVRSCLVDMGLVIYPEVPGQLLPYVQLPGDGSVVCYAASLPDEPDQVLAIYDVAGVVFGRSQRGNKYFSHYGLKLLFRALDYTGHTVFDKIVGSGLDLIVNRATKTLDGETHHVQSVYRTTSIVSLGEEPNRRRLLWSVNARVALQDQDSLAG